MLLSSLSIGRKCLFKCSQEIVLSNCFASVQQWKSLGKLSNSNKIKFTHRRIFTNSKMPQKSIASFFTNKLNKKNDQAKTKPPTKSPLKLPKTPPKLPKTPPKLPKTPPKLPKTPPKLIPKPVIATPEPATENSPIKKSGKRPRNGIISDSSEEDESSHISALDENLMTTPKKEKSVEYDTPDEIPNPSRDVTITPKGSVKRKTARKTGPSKKIKTELSSVNSGEESEIDAGKNRTKNKVDGELKNLEKLFGVEANKSDGEEKMETDDASSKPESPTQTSPIKEETSPIKSSPRETRKTKTPKSGSGKTAKKKKSPKTSKSTSNFFQPKSKKLKEENSKKDSSEENESKESEKDSDIDDKKKITPENYDPGLKKYHPINHACWGHNKNVPYLALARTFKMIEDISGRLRTIEILCNFLRSVLVLSPDEFHMCVYLSLNKLAPAYEGVELGIGESLLMKAIAEATGRNVAKIKIDVANTGDLGLVAESSKSSQKMMFTPAPLTVAGVFKKLKQIAAISGGSSMAQKVALIRSLLVACRQSEARYIIRSLGGKLRIGLAEQSVLVAIGNAAYLTPPGQDYPPAVINAGHGLLAEVLKSKMDEHSLIVKTTYCELPNYDIILKCLLEHGMDELPKRCKLTPGIPLKPMLAHPTKGVSEVLNKFEKSAFTCEFKYDGERAQIHRLENGTVNIYSRNQENNTSKYPDIIERVPNMLKSSVESCVIDAEAVAWDTENQQILPFQVLSTRKRKDAEISSIKVQVCIYAFDLLYLNGESLVRKSLRERRRLLHENFNEDVGKFVFATAQDTTDVDEIAVFLEESIKGNCEGLMVKTLDNDATYEIAKRSNNWLKLKKDYLDGMGDTLDLVVIGGYRGRGKRVGNFGGFLLACYDEESEEYQTICKIGTGFTDQDLAEHSKFFKQHLTDKPKPYYRLNDSEADQWFEPVQVWEVKAADLSLSPVYAAGNGIVDPGKGISLRFPRFLRIRDDKKPEEATNSAQVADLYSKQQQIQNQAKDKNTKEVDYY